MSEVHVSFACASDIGKVRETNEDAFAVADLTDGGKVIREAGVSRLDVGPKGLLLVVSDGMGGAKAGEVASDLVVQGFTRAMLAAPHNGPRDQTIKDAVASAHAVVVDAAQDESREGMGATLTAVHVIGRHAFVAEVGDSRAYLIRAGTIRQLTKDQSFAQLLVDAGSLKPDEAADSPMSNVLAQAMGQKTSVRPALGKLAISDRDCLLLCSDGLTKLVQDEEILRTVLGSKSLDRGCRALLDLANQRGGVDNTTVILAGVSGNLPASQEGERLSDSYEILESFSGPVPARRPPKGKVVPADVKMTR